MEWKYLQERIIIKQTVLNIITDVTQNNIAWRNVFLAGDMTDMKVQALRELNSTIIVYSIYYGTIRVYSIYYGTIR